MTSVGGGGPFKGASVFGTASGLAIRGVGCLAEPSRGLLRILDFGTQKLKVGETAWFALPYSVGAEHGRIVGQVGFTSDFKGREGFVGVAVAATDSALLRTGYSGVVYLVERLFPWISQSFDAAQGDATFAQAEPILTQLAIPASLAADVPHHEEPLRLKLPDGWQSYISIPELMGILPGYVQYVEIARRGYVLRTHSSASHDVALSDEFLSTWRQELYGPKERQNLEMERQRLADALNKTVAAYKEQERYASALKSEADKNAQVARSLEAQVRVETEDRVRLSKELESKDAEAELAKQARKKLETDRNRLELELGGVNKRLVDTTSANNRLLEEYHSNQSRLKQLETSRNETLALARKEVEREKKTLEATIAEQQRVLNEAVTSIEKLGASEMELKQRLADANLTIASNRQDDGDGFGNSVEASTQQSDASAANSDVWKQTRSKLTSRGSLKPVQEPANKDGGGNLLNVIGAVMISAVAVWLLWQSPINQLITANFRSGAGEHLQQMKERVGKLDAELKQLRPQMQQLQLSNTAMHNDNSRLVAENDRLGRNLGNDANNFRRQLAATERDLEGAVDEITRLQGLVRQAEDREKRAKETVVRHATEAEAAKAQLAKLQTAPPSPPASNPLNVVSAASAQQVQQQVNRAGVAEVASAASSPDITQSGSNASSRLQCGTSEAYRQTLAMAQMCVKGRNSTTQQVCLDNSNRAKFAQLAVDLQNCEMAKSACGTGLINIAKADFDRREKSYHWHSGLANAMDNVLTCVATSWARIPQ